MTDTLGFPLNTARRLLCGEGYSVCVEEVRSRKGTEGDDDRVVRQQLRPDGTVKLTYARFVTTLQE